MGKIFKYLILFLIFNLYGELYTQWTKQNIPGDLGIVMSIDFMNNRGITGGWKLDTIYTHGGFCYTTNYGNNWLKSNYPDSIRAVITAELIDLNIAYACGAYNVNNKYKPEKFNNIRFDRTFTNRLTCTGDTVYKGCFMKSTDGGVTWNMYGTIPPNINYLLGLDFVNINTGYMSGDISFGTMNGIAALIKTTDGGISWSKLSLPDSLNEIRNLYFINELTGYGAGYITSNDSLSPYKGVIIKTINGGINWMENLITNVNTFNDIVFINEITGYAVGTGPNGLTGVIYKTTNSGSNWYKLLYEVNDAFYLSCEAINNTINISGQISLYTDYISFPFISFSKDGGNSWSSYIFSDSMYSIVDGFIKNENTWYQAGGNILNNAVVYYTQSGGEIGLNKISSYMPEIITQFKSYPNPANPNAKINFDVNTNTSNLINLSVYNILGQLVKNLIYRKLNPGHYELTWNTSNYPDGVYFFRINTLNYSKTIKIVVLK